MRLAGLLTLALVALAVAATGAGATHSNGQGPRKDLVAGTGSFLALEGKVHVNAKSGRSGEDARGRFRLRAFGNVDVRGEVTCLEVHDGTAVIGGAIQRGDRGAFTGDGVLIEIRDNGEGSRRPPDQFNADIVPVPPERCPVPPFFLGLAPIDRGNFIVHDAAGDAGPLGGDVLGADPTTPMFPPLSAGL